MILPGGYTSIAMLGRGILLLALGLLGAAPPQAAPTASPPLGPVPLTVTFTTLPPGGALYEWDFDFLGTFQPDYTDVVAGDVSYTYETVGLYTARLVVTDDLGVQTTHDVPVAVAPTSGTPAVTVEFPPGEIAPGSTVAVTSEAVPVVGATITLYEWDVENDATIDQSGPALSAINFTAGPIDVYTLRLRVTDSLGGVTTLLRPYFVGVTAAAGVPDPDPPSITALSATTAGATSDLIAGPLSARVGDLVTFSATANAGAIGTMKFFRWDFDGRSGQVQFDRTLAGASTPETVAATHHYDVPGAYTLTLRVQDTEDFILTRTATVNVTLEPGVFKAWISQPRPGQRIFGDAVTLRAKTVPAGQTASVTFKYRPVGGGAPPPPSDPSWTTIRTVTPPPFTFLSTTWDVTGLPPGDYDVAAVAARSLGGSVDTLSNERVVVTVDPAAPEILENAGDPAALIGVERGVDPYFNESGGLSGDVIVDIPAGATPSYDRMRIERRSANPHPLEARLQGLTFLPGGFRRINFDGGLETFLVPSRVTFYVKDGDDDGLVDGETLKKTSLKVYRFNPLLQAWQPLGEQIVQPQEDLLRASLAAVGDVGIAGESDRRAPSGTSSGCGLLGIELLGLALLLRGGRRARR